MAKNNYFTNIAKLTVLLVVFCFITPASSQPSAKPPNGPTGLLFDEAANTYIKKNWKRINKVRPNALGSERIKKHRGKKRKAALNIAPAAATAAEEIEASIAPTDEPKTSAPSRSLAAGLGGMAGGDMPLGDSPDLPAFVDNSQTPWFPPINTQSGNSCAPHSIIYYQLSYAMAKDRNIAINDYDMSTKYSPKWGYNFANGGVSSNGSYWIDVYEVLASAGAPTFAQWPIDGNHTNWPLDSNIYLSALSARTNLPQYVNNISNSNTSAPNGLITVKELLNNGHILIFGTYINSFQYTSVKNNPASSNDDAFVGQSAVSWQNGTAGYHSMTIVGYNDDIWIDVNGNNVQDAGELGALKIANQWGAGYGNQGFIWFAYDAIYPSSKVAGGPSAGRVRIIDPDYAFILTTKAGGLYSPKVVGEYTLNTADRLYSGSPYFSVTNLGQTSTIEKNPEWALNKFYNPWSSFPKAHISFNGTNSPVDAKFVFDFTDLLPAMTLPQDYHLNLKTISTGIPITLKSFSLINPVTGVPISSVSGLPVTISSPVNQDTKIAYTYTQNNIPPTARAFATPTSGLAPLTVSFYGISSYDADGSLKNAQWDFGDGTSSTNAVSNLQIQHTYANNGTYIARLTVTDNYNASSISPNIVITVGSASSYILNVNAANGSVAVSPNQPNYSAGTNVTLTAAPAAGYVFSSWSGDAVGTSNPMTVTMNSNKNITANFIPTTYSVTVSAVNGSISKSPDQSSYASGSQVVLTAVPASGYTFTSWSGDAAGTANPLTVTVNSNKNITANFTLIPITYSLNTTAVNGSISKSPNLTSYSAGDVVTLTATPAAGYVFSSWSGDASGSTNPLSVTMSANKNITANFSQITYSLNTTAVNGSVSKSPNQASYLPSDVVTLTATPAAGYTFTGWSGDASGSTNPLSVTMSANKNITANFTQITYSLTTSAVNGSISKSPNKSTYTAGEQVTLTASPAAGYTFDSWGGDTEGSENPIIITIESNTNITASFAPVIINYSLNTTAVNGSISKSPNKPIYVAGDLVTLTATPAAGYTFTGWSGDASGSTNPLSVTMSANKNITANFTQITYSLITSATNGTVSKSPNQVSYVTGDVVTLTATPAAGYTFTGWNGDASGSVNPLTVTMSGNKNITANFTLIPITYSLNTTAVNGSVSKSPNLASYSSGDIVSLTATPAEGYVFSSWSGDASGSTNPLSVTMSANKSITANFTQITYSLNTSAINGSVSKNPNKSAYLPGEQVVLTATPASGYNFSSWSGNANGSTNPLTITISGNANVTANFSQITYSLNTTAVNGSVSKSPNQPNYVTGDLVTLTATPTAGYTFSGWSGDASGSVNPLTVIMSGNKNITANFALIPITYSLNTTAVNGSISKSPNLASYSAGDVVTLTATPAAGYTFSGWSGDDSGSTNPLSVTMSGNKNITANFTQITYSLNTSAINGSVSKNPNKSAYLPGEQVVLTATPASGYSFSSWSGDASGSTNPLTVTINGNANVTANFTQITYSLNTTAVNGSVSKSPNQASYVTGDLVTLTATPAAGYTFTGWSGDASGSVNPLTITMSGNKNIMANFTQITYSLTTSAVNGSISKSPNKSAYTAGEQVTLTASPAAGYTFDSWGGDTEGSENPIIITIESNTNITASFTPVIINYSLNTTAVNGTISKSPNKPIYVAGDLVTLTATPAAGYVFSSWTGDASGSTNPLSVTMSANKNITANFTPIVVTEYRLTTSAVNGTLSISPNQVSYAPGTVVTITAIPNPGYTLAYWSGDVAGQQGRLFKRTSSTVTVTMNGNKNIGAYFVKGYKLTVTAVNGTAAINPQQETYQFASIVRLTATPMPGYAFAGWSGSSSSKSPIIAFYMLRDMNLTANFVPISVAASETTKNTNNTKQTR